MKKSIKTKKFKESYGKLEDDRSFDLEYWQEQGPEAIFEAAYSMIKDYLLIKEGNADEPRIQRTVESYGKIQR